MYYGLTLLLQCSMSPVCCNVDTIHFYTKCPRGLQVPDCAGLNSLQLYLCTEEAHKHCKHLLYRPVFDSSSQTVL